MIDQAELDHRLAIIARQRSHRALCPFDGEPEHDGCWVDEQGVVVHHVHDLECTACGPNVVAGLLRLRGLAAAMNEDAAEATAAAARDGEIVAELRRIRASRRGGRLTSINGCFARLDDLLALTDEVETASD